MEKHWSCTVNFWPFLKFSTSNQDSAGSNRPISTKPEENKAQDVFYRWLKLVALRETSSRREGAKHSSKGVQNRNVKWPEYWTNQWIEIRILHHFLCSFRWQEASRMIPGWFWTFRKKCQYWRKKFTRKPKKHSTARNTEPINEWKLAFCIIFCAIFDGGKLWGRSLNDSGPFEINFKKRQKSTRKSKKCGIWG